MKDQLTGKELLDLIQRIFKINTSDKALGILVDLPDTPEQDTLDWKERREMATQWARELLPRLAGQGIDTHLYFYLNVGRNNADLPLGAWLHNQEIAPTSARHIAKTNVTPFSTIYQNHSMLISITEFSATAPLKNAAKNYLFRAATMPGFTADMLPALKLDYHEISRRVTKLKELLDQAVQAEVVFQIQKGEKHILQLDLRYRTAHASNGLFHQPGMVGNLPSGEAYIVPYEGEIAGIPSASCGELPVQFGEEIVLYSIKQNKATNIMNKKNGNAEQQETDHLRREPAYGNIAELGLGVLADFGVKPTGEILLDEKLGLHIAFGRSDHFGGQVGPSQFSCPEEVVHLDRVYLPSTQSWIQVVKLTLLTDRGKTFPIMENSCYISDLFTPSH